MRWVAVLACACLLAAACGGNNDESTSASAERQPAVTATAEPEPSEAGAGEAAETATSDDDAMAGPAPGEAELAGVTVFEIGAVGHVSGDLDYPMSPPVGGDHNPGWQNCGFYTVEVPDEQAVHSLEHGAVWVAYDADAPVDELAELETIANEATHVLASPYEDLPTTFVLSAWGRQAEVDSVSDPLFGDFVETYAGIGPTTPEPGAPCDRAFGIPPTDVTTIDQ